MSWFDTILTGAIGALLASLVAKEAAGWSPKLVEKLHRLAVSRLPEGLRDRLCEEWLACLEELPTPASRLLWAIGFWIAAERERWQTRPSLGQMLMNAGRGFGGGAVVFVARVGGSVVSGRVKPVASFKGLGWFLMAVVVAPAAYMVNSHGAAEQSKLNSMNAAIAVAKRDVQQLELRLSAEQARVLAAEAR